jgi:hypothetical protein
VTPVKGSKVTDLPLPGSFSVSKDPVKVEAIIDEPEEKTKSGEDV